MGNYRHRKLLRIWGFFVKLYINWIVSIMGRWIKVIRGRGLEYCRRLILTPILGFGKITKQKEEVLSSSKIPLYFLPTSTEILFQDPSSSITLLFWRYVSCRVMKKLDWLSSITEQPIYGEWSNISKEVIKLSGKKLNPSVKNYQIWLLSSILYLSFWKTI